MSNAGSELEDQLKEIGSRLASPPSSTDELLSLLDQTEIFLKRVRQSPSQSMYTAVHPAMNALVADELLKHSEMDVKVSVASCISEITRITAPDAPYDDNLMKEIFKAIVNAFKELHDTSSRSYPKRVSILETVAKVRSCVVMLDLECDDLIVQMFEHFLKAIRPNHATNVFTSMETIMTVVLEESDDVSQDLLICLLSPMKKRNKVVFPIARKLAEKVVGNCAVKLKPYYLEILGSMALSFSDYSKILASLCQETSVAPQSEPNASGECLESVKLEEEAGFREEIGTIARPVVSNGTVAKGDGNSMADPVSVKQKLEHSSQSDQSRNDSAIEAEPHNLGSLVADGKKARGRRRNSLKQLTDRNDRSHSYRWRKALENDQTKAIASSPKSLKALNKDQDQLEERSRVNSKSKHTWKEEMNSETQNGEKDLDENLVGSKIKVWWPDDKRFYDGVVVSFNPMSKKHKIAYLDGDQEILLLKNERWEFVENDSQTDRKGQAKDIPNHDASSEVPSRKKARTTSDSVVELGKIQTPLKSVGSPVGKSSGRCQGSLGKRSGHDLPKPEGRPKVGASKVGSSSNDGNPKVSSGSKEKASRKYNGDTPKASNIKEPSSESKDDTSEAGGMCKSGPSKTGTKSKDDTSKTGSKSKEGTSKTARRSKDVTAKTEPEEDPPKTSSKSTESTHKARQRPKDTASAKTEANGTPSKVKSEVEETDGSTAKQQLDSAKTTESVATTGRKRRMKA